MNISNLSGLSFTPLTAYSNPTKITESPSTGEKLTLSTSKPIEHVFQPPQNFSQQSISNPTEASEITNKLAAQLSPDESKNRFKTALPKEPLPPDINNTLFLNMIFLIYIFVFKRLVRVIN